MQSGPVELADITSRPDKGLTPNEIASWNLKRLRTQASMTQERLSDLMTHFGIPWSAFTVSDAELAFKRSGKGRKFTVDELALLALIFYVTPSEFLLPPPRGESVEFERGAGITIGGVVLSREAYLTDVLLRPSGIANRLSTGEISGLKVSGDAL